MIYLFCFKCFNFNTDGVPLIRNSCLAFNTSGSIFGFGVAFIKTGAIFLDFGINVESSTSLSEESETCESETFTFL